MGKHSAPDGAGVWRAALISGLKYLLIAAVLAGLAFGAWRLLTGGSAAPPAAQPTPEEFLPSLGPDGGAGASPFPDQTSTAGSPNPGPSTPASPALSSPAPSGSPVSGTGRVQLLDGAGSGLKAAKAKRKVEQAGYQVVAEGLTSRPYQVTTVFYQPGNEPLAGALQTLIGATDVLPAPANLDKSIPVTVVLGSDYAG